jgi:isopentenyl-diphosphate delta-isomerase
MAKELLDIVDMSGKIIAQADRNLVHQHGLLHREIHVWLFTPEGSIIFQKRAKDKDTWPDKLDASVGGHVDLGKNYEEAALQELVEETGIQVAANNLLYITQIHTTVSEQATHTTNNALRRIYALRYNGPLADLSVEQGKSQGFQSWSIHDLLHISPAAATQFIPLLLEDTYLDVYRHIETLL